MEIFGNCKGQRSIFTIFIKHNEGMQAIFDNKNFTLLLILARVAHLPRRVHTKLFSRQLRINFQILKSTSLKPLPILLL